MADEITSWREENDALVGDFEFPGFTKAIEFVNRVAQLAEQRNHHPDILVHGYRHVRLTLTTHSAGGKVTDSDRALAEAIDAL